MDSERECKFKVGDEVVIVNYGHLFWSRMPLPGCNFPVLFENKKEGYVAYDMHPDYVGQKGTVTDAHLTQGIPRYALEGPGKVAWYNEEQLKKI